MSESTPLTLEAFGRARVAFNEALSAAGNDVIGRPAIEEKRKVSLTFEIGSEIAQDTGEVIANVSWKISSAFPGIKSQQRTGLVEDGHIMVAPEQLPTEQQALFSAENLRQIGENK